MRLFSLFILSLTSLYANDDTIAVTENDPATLVQGVSVITGDFFMTEEDYSVAGAEPISIRRAYLSSIGGIPQYKHLSALLNATNALIISEPSGTTLSYCVDPNYRISGYVGPDFYQNKNKPIRYCVHPRIQNGHGLTNTATGSISGKSQLKNQYVIFNPDQDRHGKSFSLHAQDGTIRRYQGLESQKKAEYWPGKHAHLAYQYRLESETLPSGRKIHYEWSHKNELTAIRTTNIQDTKTFARADIPKIDPEKTPDSYSIQGSDGRSVSFFFHKPDKETALLGRVVSPDQADQTIGYINKRVTHIELPEGKTFFIRYQNDKVSELLSPIGPSGSLVPQYRFVYNSRSSSCFDALGNKTNYTRDENLRLSRIDRFEGELCLNHSETFVWDGTNIKCKVLYDSTDVPVFAKTFTYDSQGNVTEETLWGNLSGTSSPLHIGPNQLPLDDGVEKATIKRAFDSRNLMLRQEEQSGLVTEYTYHPIFHLPLSKTVRDQYRVFSRTTYQYDADNILIREETRDGSKIHKIEETKPRTAEPYIGLPDWTLEKYSDGTQEFLLQKTHFFYTKGARISRKEIYDASGVFRYGLDYTYDEKGNLTSETNPLGQKAQSFYDRSGAKTSSTDFSGRVEVSYQYDAGNRLIQKTERGFDGITETTLYQYDLKSNLIGCIDPHGNKTETAYNAFNQKIETTYPLIIQKDGSPVAPKTKTSYTATGDPISETDGEENTKTYTYNITHKVISVTTPDGATEESFYNLDGTLRTYRDPLGVKTSYTYDPLGRVIRKTIEDAEEDFIYDGSLLISHTNAEGIKTTYTYDGAGRKISETTPLHRIAYEYDSMGFLCSETDDATTILYQHDNLGRVTEQRQESLQGDLLRLDRYEYDAAGNQIAHTQGLSTKEEFEYDSKNRMIRTVDPFGGVSIITYETTVNTLGQTVLLKTEIDPMGLKTLETFDAQENLSEQELKQETTLLKTRFDYDRNDRKIAERIEIYDKGRVSRSVINRWEYDSQGRLIALIEGDGAKKTTYGYNLRGDKICITKSDGVALFYEYSPLGYLSHLSSSDGTVDHRMITNKLGEILQFDGIERTLDAHGNILLETFPSGLSIRSEYDSLDRKIKLSVREISIDYQYGPIDLEKVTCGTLSHTYTARDLLGNVLSEELIGGLGQIIRSYDQAIRPKTIQAPYFSQEIKTFDLLGNIIEAETDHEPQNYSYDPQYQLASESGFFNHIYTYDALYNRLSKDAEDYTINSLNQPTSHAIFDLNGNPSEIENMHLSYDALDRVIGIETPSITLTFTYDYLNRCLTKTHRRSTVSFIYDGQNEIGTYDGAIQELRVLGEIKTAEIGASVALFFEHAWYAPIHDLHGNIARLVGLNQLLSGRYRYSAFGEEYLQGVISPWRYSSKRAVETLFNFGRRYYVPSLGRWLTPDPLGFTAGPNLYAFVHNGPLTHFDEYGLFDIKATSQAWLYKANEGIAKLTKEKTFSGPF